MRFKQIFLSIAAASLLVFSLQGCQTTPAQRGAMGGGAIGAVAGQIIGGDTEATLLGAGIGALGGAMANDYIDKQKRDAYDQGYHDGNAPRYTPAPPPRPPEYNTVPR